jgi:hypothetical protein
MNRNSSIRVFYGFETVLTGSVENWGSVNRRNGSRMPMYKGNLRKAIGQKGEGSAYCVFPIDGVSKFFLIFHMLPAL